MRDTTTELLDFYGTVIEAAAKAKADRALADLIGYHAITLDLVQVEKFNPANVYDLVDEIKKQLFGLVRTAGVLDES